MNDTMENAASVAGIAAGQAAADELVELLAEQLDADRGVIVHLLIESGILIVAGGGTLYLTDNQIARSLAVGVVAQGTVNGARILIREARNWMQSDDDSSVDGLQGLRGLPAEQRRAVAQLMAAQQSGRPQVAPAEQQRRRERRERGPGRRASGRLASNGRVQMVRQN